MGAPSWTAHALFDRACMLRRRKQAGDLPRSEELLREAEDLARHLGMTRLLDQIETIREQKVSP